jgi:hypothetical protein
MLGVLLVVSGGLVAPGLGGIYALVQRRAPAGAVAQVFAGLTVALLGGAALGSALAGAVVQSRGPAAAFALGAVPPALAAVVVALGLLRPAGRARVAAADPVSAAAAALAAPAAAARPGVVPPGPSAPAAPAG